MELLEKNMTQIKGIRAELQVCQERTVCHANELRLMLYFKILKAESLAIEADVGKVYFGLGSWNAIKLSIKINGTCFLALCHL